MHTSEIVLSTGTTLKVHCTSTDGTARLVITDDFLHDAIASLANLACVELRVLQQDLYPETDVLIQRTLLVPHQTEIFYELLAD